MYKSQPYYIKTTNVHAQKRINTMIYYLFPRAMLQLNHHCVPTKSYTPLTKHYSPSLLRYLSELKCITQQYPEWDRACFLSHPFHQLPEVSQLRLPFICYEIFELYHLMHFSWQNFQKINSLHLGNVNTVRALKHIRRNHANDQSVVYDHPYTLDHWTSGPRGCMDLVFCDASQGPAEYHNTKDLLMQLCLAFVAQKRKGTCIVKTNDTYSPLSLDAMIILSHFYEKMYVVKPSVCLVTSGEKYLVCKGFMYDQLSEKTVSVLQHLFKTISEAPTGHYVVRALDFNVQMLLWGKFEEINSIFGQPRLEQMQQLLVNLENGTMGIEYNDVSKCKEWCDKYLL